MGGGAGKSQRLHFSPQALPYLGVPTSGDMLAQLHFKPYCLSFPRHELRPVSSLWILDLLATRPTSQPDLIKVGEM